MHIHTKYEVSILNPVPRRADADADDTNSYAQWTNHDYIGSFGRIPNEPKSQWACSWARLNVTRGFLTYGRFFMLAVTY